MKLLKPAPLLPGDTIGVVSPASPIAAYCPRRFERGVANLEAMGFQVRVSEHARSCVGHTAGTIAQRVEDLHGMFRDPQVKAIITTIGGFNSNQLLDRLDYELIASHPKILMGYSDITAILLGITQKTGLVTFLGPAVMPQFGEAGGLHPYTEACVRSVLMSPQAGVDLKPSRLSIHERLPWDKEDTRPRRPEVHQGPRVLKAGAAQGPVVAGNLGTMLALVGTPYFPDLEGALLCVEEDESESPATVDRFFTQLRLMRAFERIAGLVVGRFHPQVGFSSEDSLEELLMIATEGYDFPVAIDFDFGHTDPMFVLPQGIEARLACDGEPRLTLLASCLS